MPKRKRKYVSAPRKRQKTRRAPNTRGPSPMVVVGQTRIGGYYGRFTSGGERKFHDVSLADGEVTAALSIINLTIIPEGNGESDRIGRKITIKNISWRYKIQLKEHTDITKSSDTIKMMLVQDMQTNGAQFTALNLLETDIWESHRNLANSRRFVVLWSKDVTLASTSGGPASTTTTNFSSNRRVVVGGKSCNIQIEYDNSATTGAIGTVRSNNLYWCTQSIEGDLDCGGQCRLRYTDQ